MDSFFTIRIFNFIFTFFSPSLFLCTFQHQHPHEKRQWYFSGNCLHAGGSIILQLQLDGTIRNVDKAGFAIFVVNVLLWIDFNLTIRRQKRQREPPSSRRRFVLKGGSSWLLGCFSKTLFFKKIVRYPHVPHWGIYKANPKKFL